jgi:hypothetical protein
MAPKTEHRHAIVSLETPVCVDCGEVVSTTDDYIYMVPLDAPQPSGGTVAVRFSEEIERLLNPYTMTAIEWAQTLFGQRDFPDQDPDETTNAMLASILLAETSEAALAAMELDRAKELCGDEPGGHSPLLRIYGARPMRSEFEDGAACYVIVDALIIAQNRRIKFTTGARAVQAVILAHIGNGWMPFEAMLEIRGQKTRRGFYPLNLVAGG